MVRGFKSSYGSTRAEISGVHNLVVAELDALRSGRPGTSEEYLDVYHWFCEESRRKRLCQNPRDLSTNYSIDPIDQRDARRPHNARARQSPVRRRRRAEFTRDATSKSVQVDSKNKAAAAKIGP